MNTNFDSLYCIMETQKIWDDDNKEFTRVFSIEKVEKVNPIDYYKDAELRKRAIVLRDLLYMSDPILAVSLDDSFFIKQAAATLEGFFEKFEKVVVPENFLKLLETERKRDQEQLLKNQSITTDQLTALIFKSYKDFGYLYSKYLYENLSKGTDREKLPKSILIDDDGTVKKVGETELTDGQLKNVINHRKVIVAHFFEKENVWHCLFLTYNSLKGTENWKGGQAHFHYISSFFGITKEEFLQSMESGDYRSTSIHIELLGYGNQSK
jgi:hypothetical protein